MSGSFTNYWEEKVLKHLFGIAAYTAPGTVYVGVCTGGVTEAGVVTGEPSGNAYARVAVLNDVDHWDYSQGGRADKDSQSRRNSVPRGIRKLGHYNRRVSGD